MKLFKHYLVSTLLLTAIGTSTIASAALVSADWHTAGDNLITRDNTTGLDWLDLTETNGMSQNYVLTQLEVGGLFEGFRYATQAEAVSLWANWGVDLSSGVMPSQVLGYLDPGIISAGNMIGNIVAEYSPNYPYGALGVTSYQRLPDLLPDYYVVIGAYTDVNSNSFYSADDPDEYGQHRLDQIMYVGHYLVETSAVPIPGALWLFGSGLLGLLSVRKRKRAY